MSNEICPPVNCTAWGPLQPNSEIAGIGVIAGFMASAYLTLIMVIVHYFFDHNKTPARVDRVIIEGLKNFCLVKKCPKPSEKGSEIIEAAILMFSDQQLITGMGILISGYTQLRCSLSTYHWQIVVFLAWFSSLAHLTTLTALRGFFRRQPTLAYWRVFFMGVTMSLLGSAIYPTGYVWTQQSTSSAPLSVPAKCLFHPGSANDAYETDPSDLLEPWNSFFIVLTLSFLFISYISRVIGLFSKSSNVALKLLRIRPGYHLKKSITSLLKRSVESKSVVCSKFCYILSLTLMTVYVLLKVMFEIGQSMFWEIFWLVTALAWGTLRLFATWTGHPPDENVWGFGQVMSLLLLGLPFWSLMEQLFTREEKEDRKMKKQKKKEKEKGEKKNEKKEEESEEEIEEEKGEEKENGKEEEGRYSSPLLYPNRTHSAGLSQRTNSNTAAKVPTNASEYPDSIEIQEFESLNLEQYGWYRNLGALVFGMAILLAGDILYDFPAGSLAGDVAGFGTSSVTSEWPAIAVEYAIWLGLIGLILFLYTMVCLVNSWAAWDKFWGHVFGNHKKAQRVTEKILGYVIVLVLWTLTICFDTFLFYEPDRLYNDYYQATASLYYPG